LGDLLRAAVAEGTPAGLRAKEFMDAGDLVPDEVVVSMVVDAVSTPEAKAKAGPGEASGPGQSCSPRHRMS